MSKSDDLIASVPPSPSGSPDAEKIFQDFCRYIFELCGEFAEQCGNSFDLESYSEASLECKALADKGSLKEARRAAAPATDVLASRCYAERRLRDQIFDDPSLFGEPAWDILLDVASAEAKGERLSVSSVCIGSCSPPTTALRWLGILEDRGLLRREYDVLDGRRSFVRLTRSGAVKLWRYFENLARVRSTVPRPAT